MFYITDNQQQAVDSIDRIMTAAFNSLVIAYKQSMRFVWQHKTLTPQQVFDCFGTKAGDLVTRGMATKTFLLSQQPDLDLPEAPADITINNDGTVTLVYPSSSSSSSSSSSGQ